MNTGTKFNGLQHTEDTTSQQLTVTNLREFFQEKMAYEFHCSVTLNQETKIFNRFLMFDRKPKVGMKIIWNTVQEVSIPGVSLQLMDFPLDFTTQPDGTTQDSLRETIVELVSHVEGVGGKVVKKNLPIDGHVQVSLSPNPKDVDYSVRISYDGFDFYQVYNITVPETSGRLSNTFYSDLSNFSPDDSNRYSVLLHAL